MAKYFAMVLIIFIASLSLLAQSGQVTISIPYIPPPPTFTSDDSREIDRIVNDRSISSPDKVKELRDLLLTNYYGWCTFYEKSIMRLNPQFTSGMLEPTDDDTFLASPKQFFQVYADWAKDFYDTLVKLEEEHTAALGTSNHCSYAPIIGISAGISAYNLNYDELSSPSPYNLSAGLFFYLPERFKYNKYFEFRLDYTNSTITYDKKEHKTDFLSGIASLKLPISRWLWSRDNDIAIKAGVGYYWMWLSDIAAPNVDSPYTLWRNWIGRLELEIGLDYFTKLPFGLYASYSFIKTNENNMYSDAGSIKIDNSWLDMGSFSVGLRFFLTNNKIQ
ncbi:MAG: hypothetical protein LBO69_05325 [Ignavibacteria bacterium]|jgi:hypothetical protein|nr:hypothetical protein [Ignavibacteria bacterium]